MLELSIALVIIASIAGYLVNRVIDQRWAEIDLKSKVNTQASSDALSLAYEEQLKKFDARINDTWSTISNTKEELNALKLSIGLRKQ